MPARTTSTRAAATRCARAHAYRIRGTSVEATAVGTAGSERWKRTETSGVGSTPVISNQRVLWPALRAGTVTPDPTNLS